MSCGGTQDKFLLQRRTFSAVATHDMSCAAAQCILSMCCSTPGVQAIASAADPSSFAVKGPSAQDLALQGAVGPRFMNSKGPGA